MGEGAARCTRSDAHALAGQERCWLVAAGVGGRVLRTLPACLLLLLLLVHHHPRSPLLPTNMT